MRRVPTVLCRDKAWAPEWVPLGTITFAPGGPPITPGCH